MIDYFTEALVLDHQEREDCHASVLLYTKQLGRISAHAKGLRKITSRLAGHLQPLQFSKVRLVEKGTFRIADAIGTYRIPPSVPALELVRFLTTMTFESQPDHALWAALTDAARTLRRTTRLSYQPLLEALGFSSRFASCVSCESQRVAYFSPEAQSFLCRACVYKSSPHEVVLV